MAKKRPEFNLPSTKPAAAASKKTAWVYKSGATEPPPLKLDVRTAPDAADVRVARSELIVDRYATIAGAAAVIPIPWFDLVAIGGIQMKMVAELSARYGVPFNQEIVKSAIAGLLGSIAATRLAYEFGRTVLKTVPVIGVFGAALAMPAFAYGVTWAIGKVFVKHYEAGGTLQNFDVAKMKPHFESEVDQAQ